MTALARVVFPLPLGKPFLYAVPKKLGAAVVPGARVVAPLGPRKMSGFVVGLTTEPPPPGVEVKDILEVLDERPFHGERFLEFTGRLSEEFHSSWGELLQASVPPSLAERMRTTVVLTGFGRAALGTKALGPKERALATLLAASPKGRSPLFLQRKTGGRDISGTLARMAAKGVVEVRRTAARPPRAERGQSPRATVQLGLAFPEGEPSEGGTLARVERDISAARFSAWLLVGGPDARRASLERLIKGALGAGGRALCLFPEVAPASSFAARFKRDFGRPEVLFHGRMTPKQREESWRALRSGRAAAIVGTRSALFLEIPGLRLIAVDEEQDEAYVQLESPSYDARRGACLRARSEGAVVVLSSSRPTVEAVFQARRAGALIELGAAPPRARASVVAHSGDAPLLSRDLEAKVRGCVGRGEPVVLFLNRRGYASELACSRCGRPPVCPRCRIPLVLHKAAGKLVCHYCGHAAGRGEPCVGCRGEIVVRRGAGTQALEEEVARLFPGVQVGRYDSDAAEDEERMDKIMTDFRRGKVKILVATRLLLSRVDVPRVGLVGVLKPETLLGLPDYRAGQKAYETASAMADLAGEAEVVIQTAAPDHFAIRAAATGDFNAFAEEELGLRRALGYPPFSSLAEVFLMGRNVRSLAAGSRRIKGILEQRFPDLEVLGPTLAPVPRVRDVSRVQIVLRAGDRATIDRALREVLAEVRLRRSVAFSYEPFRDIG